MAFAHEQAASIHRDLKPDNIMVGGFGEVYVMDWGLAKVVGETDAPAPGDDSGDPKDRALTRAGAIVGTPGYMAPEQASGVPGRVSPRTDVYAIGSMLYRLLVGNSPYSRRDSTPLQMLADLRAGPPEPLTKLAPDAPEELRAIAEKAMARDPADRYASAEELGGDLQNFIEGRVVQAYRTGPWMELRKWVGRNRALTAALTAAGLAVVAGTVGYAVMQRDAVEQEREAAEEIRKQRDAARDAAKRERAHARRAEGARLCAVAVNQLEKDPARALLLAVEGAERNPGPEANDLLYAALRENRELLTLEGHDSYVTRAEFSPDGTRIASCGRDGQVLLWHAQTGDLHRRMDEHEGPVLSIDFDREGRRLVSAGADGTARIWDVVTGGTQHVLTVHGGNGIRGAEFLPDGSRVLTWSWVEDPVARLWDAGTGRLVARLEGHEGPIVDAAVTPGGRRILTVSADRTLRSWDAADGSERQRYTLAGRSSPPSATKYWTSRIDVSADGAWAVVRFDSQKADLVDLRAWRLARRYTGAWGAAFTADGSELVVALLSRKGRIERRALPGLELVGEFDGSFRRLLTDRRGRVLFGSMSMDSAPWFWELPEERPSRLRGHTYHVGWIDLSPDGTRAVSAGLDNTVRVWELVRRDELRPPEGRPWKLSPDARHAAIVEDGAVEVVDARTGAQVWRFELEGKFGSPGFPRIAGRLGIRCPDGRYRIFETATGEVLGEVALRDPASIERHRQCDVTRDGRHVIELGYAGPVRVYDAETGRVVVEAPWPEGVPRRPFHLDPDCKRAVMTIGEKRVAVVWDVTTGRKLGRITAHSGYVRHAVFGARGNTILTTAVDSTARTWDARTLTLRSTFAGLPMSENYVYPSPDGELVAVGTGGHVWLFHSRTGERRATLDLGNDRLTRVDFAADGTVLTHHRSGVGRLWPADALRHARSIVPRLLTPGERREFRVGDSREQLEGNRERATRLHSASRIYQWGRECLSDGRFWEARQAFDRAVTERPRAPWGYYGRALVLAQQELDKGGALDALDQAVERGLRSAGRIQADPMLALLRDHPRFRALIERLSE